MSVILKSKLQQMENMLFERQNKAGNEAILF